MFFKYFKDVIRQGWEKWVEGKEKKSWEEDSGAKNRLKYFILVDITLKQKLA